MEETNRKIITIISFLRKFVVVFFNIFFDIYVLKIVNDLGFIIKVNLISLIFGLIFNTLILKYMNSRNAKYIYKSSFILLLICIGILIFLKENIIQYIYFFKSLYVLEEITYAAPFEMIIMGANKHHTFSNFQANINILSAIATILTPIFSGAIIEKLSYNVLFIILGIEVALIIFTSRRITEFYVDDRKLEIKEFWNKIKKYKHVKEIYKCMFYRRISAQGAVLDLLPIILFLKLNSELSVGTYNSMFSILSICALALLKLANKRNIKKRFYVPFAIITFLSTLLLLFMPSFITLLIYYICMNTLAIVIESESCSAVYEAINTEELSAYKREHDIIFNVYMYAGKFISYGISYILYTYFYNENILSCVISVLMFFLIISCMYLQKVQESYDNSMMR